MNNTNRTWFIKGVKNGLPIAAGYLAVSFTLGIAAKNAGLNTFQAQVLQVMHRLGNLPDLQ